MFTYTFMAFFVVIFHQKICVSIFLFFDELSSIRNRISTNQKPESVIRNCQWNCVEVVEDTIAIFADNMQAMFYIEDMADMFVKMCLAMIKKCDFFRHTKKHDYIVIYKGNLLNHVHNLNLALNETYGNYG